MSAYWQIDKEWLRAEYLGKMRNTRDIAREIGCSHAVILKRLHEYGIPVRNRSEGRKLTANDYYTLAGKRDFEWLGSKVPAKANVETRWRCNQGHEWEARYNNIQQGKGCPYCANRMPKTAEDYHILAKDRGFEWLGLKIPSNVTTAKTQWVCSQGHQWETCYNNIQQGCGCPVCAHLKNRGKSHHNWRGGISFHPYTPGFNDNLRLAIRERDYFTCQLCSELENGKAYSCHHIDWGKINHHSWNLIALCASCHGKVHNIDYDVWQWKFSAIIFARHSQGDIRWVGST